MADRQRVAQGPPPRDLTGFPTVRVGPDTELFRCHRATLGPWWFGNDGGGRFDLPSPRGTCYLALDPEAAVREWLGPVLGGRTSVPESALEDAVVSRLSPPGTWEVADLQSRRAAAHGVTRELEVMVPYAVPQAWAVAFDSAGMDGVRYGPRFTPGAASSLAAFGEEGRRSWPADERPVPAVSVPGIPAVLDTPRRADLTVVRTPRTRARG